MAVNLSPVFNDQIFTLAGVPAAGYKLFTYAAGSTTKTNTYTTSTGNVANANPIILDSNGYASNGSAQVQIWLTAGTSYKFVLAPSTDTDPPSSPIRTEDNITGVNDTVSSGLTEWTASTFTGITFVSGTQFTVTGDQTAILTLYRRLKTTNTAGTIYSYISAVDYNISNASKTTVTVVNDSGTLDSGLSAVSYGIINPTNSSLFPSKVTQVIQFTGNNTHAGTETMSGASIIEANASIAANATTSNIWSSGNYVTLTGTAVTFTNFAAAPQAGAAVELYCNDTHTFTNNANLVVDGAANFTAAVGDRILVRAKSTTVFLVRPLRLNGHAIIGSPWVPLSSKSASSSSLISFGTSDFTNTAFPLFMVAISKSIPGTNAQTLQVQISEDNGVTPKTDASYTNNLTLTGSNGTDYSVRGSAATFLSLQDATNRQSTNEGFNARFFFYNPSDTTHHQFTIDNVSYFQATSNVIVTGQGCFLYTGTTNAWNYLKFFYTSGNIASGTFTLYGLSTTS